MHYLSAPEAVDAVVSGDVLLDTGRANAACGSFEDIFGPTSLVVLDGEEQVERRAWVAAAMRSDDLLRSMNSVRPLVRQSVEEWPYDKTFELYTAIRRLGLLVASNSVLGLEGEELELFVDDVGRFLDSASEVSNWLLNYKDHLATMDQKVAEMIQRRKRDPGDDMLTRLMARERDWVTDQHLRDACITMIILGHEGPSVTLSWLAYHLMIEPAARSYIEREVVELAGKGEVSPGDLRDAQRLDNIIRESLRLYPPLIATHRLTRESTEVGGYTFPCRFCAGTLHIPGAARS